jgi:hypothetical protein
MPPITEKNEASIVRRADKTHDDGVGGDSYVAASATLGMVGCSKGGNVFQATSSPIHVGLGEGRSGNAIDHLQHEAMFEMT